jgi:hypothetical protein
MFGFMHIWIYNDSEGLSEDFEENYSDDKTEI